MMQRISRQYRRAISRIQQRGTNALLRALRLTGASVAAYVVAGLFLEDTVPVIAALTALLVVEVTLFDIVTSGVQRVVSVVSGVLLAVGFSSLVGISWWSLGILVAISILVGQLLRLGPHLVEVPISAMLVLAVGGEETVASDRIVETLIGAAVGVAVNIAFPPRIRADTAARAVGAFAEQIAALLQTAADELLDGITTDEADRWLEESRRLSRHVPRIDRALAEAEQSRRLNPRALAKRDTAAVLRHGLESLEHSSVAVRSMFRSIADGVRDHPQPDNDAAQAVQQAFATLLSDLAEAVNSYGDLVRAEVAETTKPAEIAAATALTTLREARARVIELRLVDHHDDLATWELNDTLLETVERVLAELDIEEQTRRRQTRPHHLVDPRAVFKAAHQGFRAGTEQLGEHPFNLYRREK
jgi:Aromatic acid exporter family member 1